METHSISPASLLIGAACPFPAPQGSQIFIRSTIQALLGAGARVCLAAYSCDAGQEFAAVDCVVPPAGGIRPRVRAGPSWRKVWLDPALYRAARRAMRRKRFDAVHAHNIEALSIFSPLARAHGAPLVYGAHGRMGLELPSYFAWSPLRAAAAAAGNALDRLAARRADGIHALSPADGDFWRSLGAGPDRVLVAPPPFDPREFDFAAPSAPPPAMAQQKGFWFAYVGNLDGYQGLETLRQAFAQLRGERPEARLLLASHRESGGYAAVRRRWAGERGVAFHSLASFAEARAAMLAADALVCPRSLPGGFPIKLLNYMAAAKPVVACETAARAMPRADALLAVRDACAGDFARAMRRLADDAALRARLGAAGRECLERDYSPARIGAQLLAFYERLRNLGLRRARRRG